MTPFRHASFIGYCLTHLALANPSAPIVVSTGPEGGQYHAIGTAIAEVLGSDRHVPVSSRGSVDNLMQLLSEDEGRPQAQLAIVQSDILHRLHRYSRDDLPEALASLPENSSEIRTLFALFPEYVQILVRHDSNILIPSQLIGRPLFLGDLTSGSRLNALDLLGYFASSALPDPPGDADTRWIDVVTHADLLASTDITLDQLNAVLAMLDEPATLLENTAERPVSSRLALEMLKAGWIDAAFVTQGSLVDDPDLRHLHLSRNRVEDFRKEFEIYGVQEVNLPGRSTPAALPFVRANLVAMDSKEPGALSRSEVREIVRRLHLAEYDIERRMVDMLDTRVELFMDDHKVRRVTDQLHPGASDFFKSVNIIARISLSEIAFVIPLVLIGLTFLGNSMRHTAIIGGALRSRPIRRLYRPDSNFQRLWDGYRSWICGSWIMVFVWIFLIFFVLVVYFIRLVEKQQSVALDIENPFAGTSFWDAAFWMLTFAATGFNQDIYPNTTLAKILAIMVPISGLLLSLFVLVTHTFRSARETERRSKGLIPPPALKDHILICGWNERVPSLLKEMTSRFSPLGPAAKIVLVSEPESEKPLESLGGVQSRSYFYRGNASDPEVLAKVSAHHAKSVLVLADNHNLRNQNLRSILTTVALSGLSGKGNDHAGGNGGNPPAGPTIVAELFFEQNRNRFEHAGAAKIVSLETIAGRAISHAILNPGVSGLLVSLLRFSNGQVLRRLKTRELGAARNGIDLAGATFAEAASKLRTGGRQLLAIHRAGLEAPGSSFELEFREQSPYIIRPHGADATYQIQSSDDLIFIEVNQAFGIGGASQERRYLSSGDMRHIRSNEECILLIGNGMVGAEVAAVLAARVRRVIWLAPVDVQSKPRKEALLEHDSLIRLAYEGHPDTAQLRNLEQHLDGVTRVIILGPDRSSCSGSSELNQDDATLLTALTIRKLGESGFAPFENIHLAAEMRSGSNLALFHRAGVHQPIPTMELHELALAQMAFHRGVVTELLLKSMSYSPKNRNARLVRIPVGQFSERLSRSVIGMNFDDFSAACIESGMNLLAIHSAAKLRTDEFAVIVNPPPCHSLKNPQICQASDSIYQVQPDDFVFVFDDPASH